jgi:hypothetical protein
MRKVHQIKIIMHKKSYKFGDHMNYYAQKCMNIFNTLFSLAMWLISLCIMEVSSLGRKTPWIYILTSWSIWNLQLVPVIHWAQFIVTSSSWPHYLIFVFIQEKLDTCTNKKIVFFLFLFERNKRDLITK